MFRRIAVSVVVCLLVTGVCFAGAPTNVSVTLTGPTEGEPDQALAYLADGQYTLDGATQIETQEGQATVEEEYSWKYNPASCDTLPADSQQETFRYAEDGTYTITVTYTVTVLYADGTSDEAAATSTVELSIDEEAGTGTFDYTFTATGLFEHKTTQAKQSFTLDLLSDEAGNWLTVANEQYSLQATAVSGSANIGQLDISSDDELLISEVEDPPTAMIAANVDVDVDVGVPLWPGAELEIGYDGRLKIGLGIELGPSTEDPASIAVEVVRRSWNPVLNGGLGGWATAPGGMVVVQAWRQNGDQWQSEFQGATSTDGKRTWQPVAAGQWRLRFSGAFACSLEVDLPVKKREQTQVNMLLYEHCGIRGALRFVGHGSPRDVTIDLLQDGVVVKGGRRFCCAQR